MDKGRVAVPKAGNIAQHQNIKGLVCHGKAFEFILKAIGSH